MSEALVITGAGLVSPLGLDLPSTWRAILDGRTVVGHARCPDDADAAAPSRVSALAIRAAREAIAAAEASGRRPDGAAPLIVGTSKGPVDQWLSDAGLPQRRGHDVASDNPAGRPFGLHEVADDVARSLGRLASPRLTISAACASGIHALIRAAVEIRAGRARHAVVVAAESSLHPLFIASFRRLGVVPAEGELVRPFDRRRSGFFIAEAAAAICIEARRPIAGDVAVEAFALGGDATHLTGIDPGGATLRRLLSRAADGEVDLVHAHGTATPLNDPVELGAIEATCGRPVVWSHKAALGHALGAAGLVAAALSVQAHVEGVVPGNVNTREPLAGAARLPTTPERLRIARSLLIAAGFGGACAVVRLATR